MKYEKPKVALIATATAAIQGMTKNGSPFDNPVVHTLTAPAYEADE